MKVKVGDVVHVRATVLGIHPDGDAALDFGGRSTIWGAYDIVHVEPPPFQVGDRVRWAADQLAGDIRAIDGTQAWVRHNDRNMTWSLSDLKHA